MKINCRNHGIYVLLLLSLIKYYDTISHCLCCIFVVTLLSIVVVVFIFIDSSYQYTHTHTHTVLACTATCTYSTETQKHPTRTGRSFDPRPDSRFTGTVKITPLELHRENYTVRIILQELYCKAFNHTV